MYLILKIFIWNINLDNYKFQWLKDRMFYNWELEMPTGRR